MWDGERATNPHDLGLIPRTHSGRRTDSSKLSSIHPTHLCHVHTHRLLNVNKKKDKLHGKGVKPQGSFTWKWSAGRHWCAEHYSYKYWMALSFPVQLFIMHSCDSLPQNDIHASHPDDWPRNLPATQAAFYIHKNSHCPKWSAHSEVCDLASILTCFPSLTASSPCPILKRSSLFFCNTEMTPGQGCNGYIVSEFSTAHPDLFLSALLLSLGLMWLPNKEERLRKAKLNLHIWKLM